MLKRVSSTLPDSHIPGPQIGCHITWTSLRGPGQTSLEVDLKEVLTRSIADELDYSGVGGLACRRVPSLSGAARLHARGLPQRVDRRVHRGMMAEPAAYVQNCWT